jgi:hypothetical protein
MPQFVLSRQLEKIEKLNIFQFFHYFYPACRKHKTGYAFLMVGRPPPPPVSVFQPSRHALLLKSRKILHCVRWPIAVGQLFQTSTRASKGLKLATFL